MVTVMKFLRAQEGAVVPVFAMLLVAILGIAGGAIDIGRAHAAKDELQHALDAAVLSIASSADDGRIERGKTTFSSNLSTNSLLTLQPVFSIQPDGSVEGTISGPIPSTLLKVVGISTMSVALRSVASSNFGSTIEMTFTPVTAKGIYDKQVFLFVRDSSGAVVSLEPVLDYDFLGNPGSGIPAQSGAITNTNNQQTFTVTVEKGQTYGLMMRVWPDQSWAGERTVEPVDYYSDVATDFIKTVGNCDSGQRNNWEDTGDGDYADFIYDVECAEATATSPSDIRLVE